MFCSLVLTAVSLGADPTEVPLYGAKMNGPVSTDAKNIPTLTHYLAPMDKAVGSAVVICPGGGYSMRAIDHEGKQVAEWLNARGVHAFVLRYRTVGEGKVPAPLHPGPMLDVQRAIRTVRGLEKKYGIDPTRVGVLGFSAGGHLASTAATHFDSGTADADEPLDRLSCRPDFAVLCYPVISMQTGITHNGSRRNLLGEKPEEKLVQFYSNERQVTKDTPPTFIFHTDEDKAVLPENAILFYTALKRAGVPAELHIYEKGPHGVGLASDPKWAKGAPNVNTWPDRLEGWMKVRGLLSKK